MVDFGSINPAEGAAREAIHRSGKKAPLQWSYCAKSDLFTEYREKNIRRLSPEECKRQAEYYRSLKV